MKNEQNIKATLTEIESHCSCIINSHEKSSQTHEDANLCYIQDKLLDILQMGWPKEYGLPI